MKEEVERFLKEKFPHFLDTQEAIVSNVPVFFLKAEGIVPVVSALKNDPVLNYNFLNDLTAVDWLGKKEPRFEVNYLLRSGSKASSRIQIKVRLEEEESVPSITSVFKGADWPEREVYDLFGISFVGHPNLDRILMPDNFQGHPLRKDFPLEGFGQDYLIEDLLHIHVNEDIAKEGGKK
ncbi:NADH-quinone oxidoreductase subunit C [Leptospira santarosai]|uniref:NADH-quinone oxidoreductase subunit C n=1 Tax=Leptospira santarosai serovar Shermani str. LT 821 TaxID=758847 RepID=K8Y3F0_9LEPT|nr:NADH-quinone oxidoreductase subunit C [Leptospira santarosai]EKS09272.1 NADH dehydrogenase, C subunit [Leptospira santarosai str. JET]EKT88133.1 NADH dehydrogenase [Leptospira santarosai serovar Shermani str. LT 821]EPG83309.1 NADH dehydrogenase, C subunit [Leptospira santarosai serovar Shermani str. 1342KT]MDI7188254.1 NADH-quinone oxidoreductase subunit C [Leptospira santarosai]MDI7203846.1 NADH-quinone oxidoreductase subunit C [Leptospira santarosai]